MLIGSNQLHGEALDLVLQLIDELRLWVVIPYWFVLDLGSFGCVCQSHIVFFEVCVTRVYVGNHTAGRVAS